MKRSIGMKSSYVLTHKSVDYEITKISALPIFLSNLFKKPWAKYGHQTQNTTTNSVFNSINT